MADAPTALTMRHGHDATTYRGRLQAINPAASLLSHHNDWFRSAAHDLTRDQIARLDALQNMVEAAKVRPGERVLELGCGTGLLTQLLAEEQGPPSNYTLCDQELASLKIATECMRRRFREGYDIQPWQADISRPNVQRVMLSMVARAGKFDVVVASDLVNCFVDDSIPNLISFALALGKRFVFDYTWKDLYSPGAGTVRAIRQMRRLQVFGPPQLYQVRMNMHRQEECELNTELTPPAERQKTEQRGRQLIQASGAFLRSVREKHTLPPWPYSDESVDIASGGRSAVQQEQERVARWATIQDEADNRWRANPVTADYGVRFRDDSMTAFPVKLEVGYIFSVCSPLDAGDL